MKLQELIKMEKKLQKVHLSYYNLMMAQDLWKAHYQILSKVFLKEFIKLNLNMDIMIKKCGTCRTTYELCDCFLEYTNFKYDLIECKCLCCNKNYQSKFDEN